MNGTRERGVVAVAGDPGGASAVAPVIEALIAAGVPVTALPYNQAVQVWGRRGLQVEELSAATAAWAASRERELSHSHPRSSPVRR